MVVKLKMNLKAPLEAFCDRFPLFSMVVMQAVMAVGAIALAGGTVIWLFYRAVGLM